MQKQKMKVGHISGNTSSLIFDIVNTILLLMVCVITLYPFLNTVAISFNDSTDAVYGGIYLWPRVFSLRSYETILLQSSTIPHSALISALRAVIGTALSIPLSMMLAYVMSRRDFVLRSAVTKLVLFTMYVSGGLIPTFLTYRAYGLMNNFLVYILPGCISAFNVLVMRSFIQGLPYELIESAKIDGANEWHIFWNICLPQCRSALYSIAILVFIDNWNMVEQPLILLNDVEKQPLSMFLSSINAGEIGIAFAAAVIYMIPGLLLFLHGEAYLVEGIAHSGSVKG